MLMIAVATQTALARFENRLEWPLYFLTQDAAITPLKLGQKITHQISGNGSKSFSVGLTAGEYAAFRVEQHGIILLASLHDPQNKPVIEIDTPAGGHGPIVFSIVAQASGTYRLEVASKNKWTNPAKFDLTFEERRAATPNDQQIAAAHRDFAEGRKNVRNDNFRAALPFYERSMKFWRAAKNTRWEALTHFALAQAYAGVERGRPSAMKELEAALVILNKETAPNDWRLKASALNDLGSHHTYTDELDRSINLLQQARDLYLQHQDRRGQASALNNLAIAYVRLGDYSLALKFVDEAIRLRFAENDLPGATNVIPGLGVIADRRGEPEKALHHLSQALRHWEQVGALSPGDRRRVALLLTNLATVNDKLGRWEQARDLYDKALTMSGEGYGRILTLNHKGELYASLGDFKKARECYEEALRLLPEEKFDAELKAGILVHLGQLFSMEGNVAAAVKMFEQARALKPPARRLADVLTNLGAALALQSNLDRAIASYEEAFEIQKKSEDIRGQALTLQRRGEAYTRLKKPQAFDDLKQALEYWKSVKDVRGTAATLNALARAEEGRGNLVEALRYSNEAINVVESQRMTLASRELRTAYFATQENYFALNIQLNMKLSWSTGDTEYVARALETNEKSRARVLLESLKEIGIGSEGGNQTSDKRLSDLIEQRRSLMNRLAAKAEARSTLLNSNPKAIELAAFDKEIDSLTEQSDALDAQIRSLSPRFATLTRPRPATLKEIQQQLDPNTLLLEYSLGDKQSYVWTVTTDSIHGFELAGREQIESAASRLREAVSLRTAEVKDETASQREAREAKADKDYAEAARSLSGLVVAPVASEFRHKRLVVVPDGALQNISFSSLPTDTDLIEKHEIVVLPSASVIGVLREQIASRKQPQQTIVILANPVFGADDDRVKSARSRKRSTTAPQRFDSRRSEKEESILRSVSRGPIAELPFSRREAQSILQVAPKGQARALLGFEASRSRALSPEMARFRYIHFATHGVVDLERPALSHIILSLVDQNGEPQDGYLLLHDIYNLNLPADLVVLSACQTGVGKQVKGEGLIALTRGFMYAGAARLVASYWDVDDAATAELMAEFYKQIFTNGKRPAEALQAAQLHLRRQPRWNAPIFWAGFFIQGEWK